MVQQREQLDRAARRYGMRPSELLGLPAGSWDALLADACCALAGQSRTARTIGRIAGGGMLFPTVPITEI